MNAVIDRDDVPVLNGINGATGSYLSALSLDQIARIARGEPVEAIVSSELRVRHEATDLTFGAPLGIDPQDLAQVGWGVVFAHDVAAEVVQALKPLLDLRRAQSGDLFKTFADANAYRPGEKARAWLGRNGAELGEAQVKRVPYYLLIVGGPESIPFRFQYELGVNYAVGRIAFDSAQEYGHYAQSVMAAEQRRPSTRRACFFAVRNDDDRATQMSCDLLMAPLAAALQAGPATTRSWQVQTLMAAEATKAALAGQLNGDDAPALLVTASHGMGFPKDDPLQLRHQGALLCQDWPGPRAHRGAIPGEHYFSADDVADGASTSPAIAFHFACYGAGTPQLDDYAHADGVRAEIASAPFLASLPRRLLGRAQGGTLAVVGHVERAWTYSFTWPGLGAQTHTFESCLGELMKGARVGAAMDAFSMKHADLAVSLNGELEDLKFGARPDDRSLAGLWTANNDARSYVVIGDPAVQIP
ncbi:hypothetical protein HIV01_010515 [Lysobacter arenosi]|uniref:Gingipain domain-containing protein n=1 Tax=Lysobacter arenosi TaxID=2795387 RepID=A0ABX7R6J8_9GAMM|nr:C25 family cysteine peptidase [Lysobacter arenosi]QSX73674.1 hypothetical protein HIV01_010515 [Lysobacter arenosi]